MPAVCRPTRWKMSGCHFLAPVMVYGLQPVREIVCLTLLYLLKLCLWWLAGQLNDSDPAGRPLHLPLTQSWRSAHSPQKSQLRLNTTRMCNACRPFGVEPAGRKVQGGYVMEWNHGQVQMPELVVASGQFAHRPICPTLPRDTGIYLPP